ncbi:F-box only protein 21 [Biomphalaria glabrata]|nr:F-box only protein 21 [Biomphalaria glabrata]
MPFPDVGQRGGLLYIVLVLAIPLQYYISNTLYVPSGQREAVFKRLMKSLTNIHYNYLSFSSWHRWCSNVWQKVGSWSTSHKTFFTFDTDEMGESPAFDVIQFKHPQGHFGTSTNIRSPRPSEVKYKVGQVVKHKIWGYRGVIIGWDPIAKAPEDWLNQMHPADKRHWRKMPNYSLLVDVRDRPEPQMTYVPQENIELLTDTEIQHPNLQNYFDSFDGVKYIMRPALKYFYPRD